MNKNEERGESGFSWPVVIKNPNARASLDYYYGPYASEDDMKASVPNELWVPGFTAAVQSADGSVEEWWVQGEGAAAQFVRKHEMAIPDGSMRFMGLAGSMTELNAKENPSKGDVWQVYAMDGRGDKFFLYMYDGQTWAPLSKNYTLTVTKPDGTSSKYDGSEAVALDLTDVVTSERLEKLEDSIKGKYATVAQLQEKASKHNGAYGVLTRMDSNGAVLYYKSDGSAVMTGINLGTDKYPDLRLSRSDGFCGITLSQNNILVNINGNTLYRLNPIVLAVRLVDIEGTNTTGNTCTVGYLYNPYNLSVTVSDVDTSAGYYKLTHNMYTKGLVTKKKYNSNGDQDDMFSYVVMGTAHAYNSVHPLFVTAISCHGDYFTFTTSDDHTPNSFKMCNIMIYDFSAF